MFYSVDTVTADIYTLSLHDALPISCFHERRWLPGGTHGETVADSRAWHGRSEERRVGKECRSRWLSYHEKKNSKIDRLITSITTTVIASCSLEVHSYHALCLSLFTT